MFITDQLLLIGSFLLLFGILSNKLSNRFGIPVLVLFLGIGMLAGSEGIGKIAFENYELAHGIGTLALALILFDGGLRTSFSSIRVGWKPAGLLATAGVLITAGITGAAAFYFIGLPWLHGLLLGSIISSTDAAAVFSILKTQGVQLKEKLSATLEIESGSNDPMAVFLTIGLLTMIQSQSSSALDLLSLFFAQMIVGTVVGILVGYGGTYLINRINLGSQGLYPVLAGAVGMIAFSVAAFFGGSGFLAVYLAGIFIGNKEVVFFRGIYRFHDAMAWLAQMCMFIILGLLAFPSSLLDVAFDGLLIAIVLILVARPIAVLTLMLPFGFSWREITLLSWGGLKGAVPIILATYPLLFGLPEGRFIFDIVFFAVLVSALTQGWSLAIVAEKLGLKLPLKPEPAANLEIISLRYVNADIFDYVIEPESPATGLRIMDLPLPEGVLIALVSRDNNLVPPSGATELNPGDHVFVVMQRDYRKLMDRLFSGQSELALPDFVEFPLRDTITIESLRRFYHIDIQGPGDMTLGQFVTQGMGHNIRIGDCIECGQWTLTVRPSSNGNQFNVGLRVGSHSAAT